MYTFIYNTTIYNIIIVYTVSRRQSYENVLRVAAAASSSGDGGVSGGGGGGRPVGIGYFMRISTIFSVFL